MAEKRAVAPRLSLDYPRRSKEVARSLSNAPWKQSPLRMVSMMRMTSMPLLVLAVPLSTGCVAMKVNESVEDVDQLLNETPRQEYTGEPELLHEVGSTDTSVRVSTKVARPCVRWNEREVHRIRHTSRTLVSPNESEMRGLLLYGGAAVAGGIGFGIYGATGAPDEDTVTGSYALAAAGVGVGGVLLGNWIKAKKKSKDTDTDLGTLTLNTERISGACDEEPLSATPLEVRSFGLERMTDDQGRWTLDMRNLDDGYLQDIASGGLVVEALAPDRQYTSSIDDSTLRGAAASELQRREAERAAQQAEEAARARQAALAALPTTLKQYRGPWKLTTKQSPVDDSLTIIATRPANSAITGWPRQRRRPSLTLRCLEGRTEAFIYTGFSPQVEQHGYNVDLATVILRLDKGQAVKVLGSKSSNGEALFLPNAKEVMQQLAEHESLYFQFTPFNSNPAETTFTLTGAREVVDFIRLGCDW